MAVFVDAMRPCLGNRNWRHNASCHLLADTNEELHSFACIIGLGRSWFQEGLGSLPHYDLSEDKRRLAIEQGALAVTNKQVIERIRRKRARCNIVLD